MVSPDTTPLSEGKAIIYCRVSTRHQEEEGTSLDTQEAACIARARELGYEVGPIFRETYSGAEIFDRPKLNELRELVRTNQYRAVIVYAIDRLSRAQGLTLYIYNEFQRRGTELISITDPLDTTPVGKLILSANEFVAEMEREKIRERSVRGRRAVVESGRLHNCAIEMYGYRRDKVVGKRHTYEPEAMIVREIFERVAEGDSYRAIAADLNARGIPSPATGKKAGVTGHWHLSSVRSLVLNPAYKGHTVVWTRKGSTRSALQLRPEAEHITLPEGTTPAIVSPALWEEAQERTRANRGAKARNVKRPALLRGLIVCARCKRPMYPEWRKPGDGHPHYRCATTRNTGVRCDGRTTRADLAESTTWEAVSSFLRTPHLIEQELARLQEKGPDARLVDELESTRAHLASLDRQEKRLLALYASADEDMPLEAIKLQLQAIQRDRQTWRDADDRLEYQIAAHDEATAQLADLSLYVERVAANLRTFDFEEKRLAMEALGVQVEANGGDVKVYTNLNPKYAVGVENTTHASIATLGPRTSTWGSTPLTAFRR